MCDPLGPCEYLKRERYFRFVAICITMMFCNFNMMIFAILKTFSHIYYILKVFDYLSVLFKEPGGMAELFFLFTRCPVRVRN